MSQYLDMLVDSAGATINPGTWLDQLQQASFRDVSFHVDTIDWTMGLNVVVREYPFQDLPTIFSMGRAAQEIKLSAYVIGDDYHRQRDTLAEALDGEGILIHPTAGAMRVFVAGKFSIKESPTAEGGMARFDITFVRSDSQRYPVTSSSSADQVVTKGAMCKRAALDAFAVKWSVAGAPSWVADAAVSRVTESVAAVWSQLASASQDLGDYTQSAIASYQVLRDGLQQLVRTPAQLADNIATLFELPGELTNAAARQLQVAFKWVFSTSERIKAADYSVSVMPAVGAGLVMYGTGSAAALTVDSAARTQLKQLQAASDQLFETLATAAYVQAGTQVALANYDEAMAMRQAVHTQCVRLLTSASGATASQTMAATSWHDGLMALHTSALADLQARSRNLVRLDSYTPEAWMSVWVISHQLYGTAAYADEILAMNPHIENPLLVQPGRALRVVKHA